MAKLIQICASQNDLFGLDSDGVVHHYNFNTNNWKRLGHGTHDGGAAAEGESIVADEEGLDGRGRLEVEPSARRGA